MNPLLDLPLAAPPSAAGSVESGPGRLPRWLKREIPKGNANHFTAGLLESGAVMGAVTSQATPVAGCLVRPLGVMRYTAVATPGHTMGSMSWRWQACEGSACRAIVFASSLNPVSAEGYRFTSKAGAPFVAGFEESYRKMDATPCDILIAAHPDNAGPGRYSDAPGACRAYADRSRELLAKRLAAERAGAR